MRSSYFTLPPVFPTFPTRAHPPYPFRAFRVVLCCVTPKHVEYFISIFIAFFFAQKKSREFNAKKTYAPIFFHLLQLHHSSDPIIRWPRRHTGCYENNTYKRCRLMASANNATRVLPNPSSNAKKYHLISHDPSRHGVTTYCAIAGWLNNRASCINR